MKTKKRLKAVMARINPKTKSVVREYVESIVIAVVLALFVRAFIVQAFKIPTGSMKPTLNESNRIFVNKYIYRFSQPQRGDIVVFKYPEDPKKDFIKRLIAKEGETVEISDGDILIDGKPADEPRIKAIYYYNRGDWGQPKQKITVPKDCFYVLGDNSASSRDSRYWGFVPKRYILGKAIFRYWPLNAIGKVK
jgi:signal peptidase I